MELSSDKHFKMQMTGKLGNVSRIFIVLILLWPGI